jgi:hypothetical protein
LPITTPQDLISFALRATGVLGTGQTALAEDYADGLSALNAMIGEWNRERWLIFHLITVEKVSTGAQSYTIGNGGDFDTPRPDRIESAFFRQIVSSQSNLVDYPLEIIEAREDYNLIALKTLTTWPQYIFYDSGYPIGNVFPWPIPQASTYSIHLSVKAQFSQFTSYIQPINLPPEYIRPLWTNLAIELSMIYPGVKISDDLRGRARASLQTIRGANAQIAELRMPSGLGRGLLYNILSDRIY